MPNAKKLRANVRRQKKKAVKRPKKVYRPREREPLFAPEFSVEESRRIMRTLFIYVYEHLGKGTMEVERFWDLVMLFNQVQVGLIHRGANFDQEGLKEFRAVFDPAMKAVQSMMDRYVKTGKVGCAGQELTAILSAMQPVADFVFESLDVCPKAFSREAVVTFILILGDEQLPKAESAEECVRLLLARTVLHMPKRRFHALNREVEKLVA